MKNLKLLPFISEEKIVIEIINLTLNTLEYFKIDNIS